MAPWCLKYVGTHHYHLLDHQQPAKRLRWIRRQNQKGWALIDTRPRLGSVLPLRNYSTDYWNRCVVHPCLSYGNFLVHKHKHEKHSNMLYAIMCLARFSPSAESSGGFQGSAMVWSCSMLSPPRFTYWAKHIVTSWSIDSICIICVPNHKPDQTILKSMNLCSQHIPCISTLVTLVDWTSLYKTLCYMTSFILDNHISRIIYTASIRFIKKRDF